MKRVRICSLAVCLVLTLTVLMPVASAVNLAAGVETVVLCPGCGAFQIFRLISYRQPTSTSSGYVSGSCKACGYNLARTTKYWGGNLGVSYDIVGLFDVVSFTCPYTNKSELGFVIRKGSSNACLSNVFFELKHLGTYRTHLYLPRLYRLHLFRLWPPENGGAAHAGRNARLG